MLDVGGSRRWDNPSRALTGLCREKSDWLCWKRGHLRTDQQMRPPDQPGRSTDERGAQPPHGAQPPWVREVFWLTPTPRDHSSSDEDDESNDGHRWGWHDWYNSRWDRDWRRDGNWRDRDGDRWDRDWHDRDWHDRDWRDRRWS